MISLGAAVRRPIKRNGITARFLIQVINALGIVNVIAALSRTKRSEILRRRWSLSSEGRPYPKITLTLGRKILYLCAVMIFGYTGVSHISQKHHRLDQQHLEPGYRLHEG